MTSKVWAPTARPDPSRSLNPSGVKSRAEKTLPPAVSAYHLAVGREPRFTNFTHKFQDTLDYIFAPQIIY